MAANPHFSGKQWACLVPQGEGGRGGGTGPFQEMAWERGSGDSGPSKRDAAGFLWSLCGLPGTLTSSVLCALSLWFSFYREGVFGHRVVRVGKEEGQLSCQPCSKWWGTSG